MSERYTTGFYGVLDTQADNLIMDSGEICERLNALTAERDALVAQNQTLVEALEKMVVVVAPLLSIRIPEPVTASQSDTTEKMKLEGAWVRQVQKDAEVARTALAQAKGV